MFSDSVPEVECAVGTCCAEGTMDGMVGDGINRVDAGHVVLGSVAVALE